MSNEKILKQESIYEPSATYHRSRSCTSTKLTKLHWLCRYQGMTDDTSEIYDFEFTADLKQYVNSLDSNNKTPLYYAIANDYYIIVQKLIDNGADVNLKHNKKLIIIPNIISSVGIFSILIKNNFNSRTFLNDNYNNILNDSYDTNTKNYFYRAIVIDLLFLNNENQNLKNTIDNLTNKITKLEARLDKIDGQKNIATDTNANTETNTETNTEDNTFIANIKNKFAQLAAETASELAVDSYDKNNEI